MRVREVGTCGVSSFAAADARAGMALWQRARALRVPVGQAACWRRPQLAASDSEKGGRPLAGCHTVEFQFWDVNIFSNTFVHHLYILRIIQILLAFILNFL